MVLHFFFFPPCVFFMLQDPISDCFICVQLGFRIDFFPLVLERPAFESRCDLPAEVVQRPLFQHRRFVLNLLLGSLLDRQAVVGHSC